MTIGLRELVLVTMIGAGCNAAWVVPGGLRGTQASALADADREATAGNVREASARYEAIVRDHPKDAAAPEALHRLAMLRVDPVGQLRDRRAAQALLRRLATEYRDTLPGREARAWRVLLQQIDRCEAEAARRGADIDKLRQTLDAIKDSDLELEHEPRR